MSNCYSKHDTCIIQWNCSKIWPAVFKLHASYLLKEIRKLLSRSKVKVLRHRNLTTSVVQTQQHMFTPRFHRFCLDRQTDRQKHTDIHPQTHRQRDTERHGERDAQTPPHGRHQKRISVCYMCNVNPFPARSLYKLWTAPRLNKQPTGWEAQLLRLFINQVN